MHVSSPVKYIRSAASAANSLRSAIAAIIILPLWVGSAFADWKDDLAAQVKAAGMQTFSVYKPPHAYEGDSPPHGIGFVYEVMKNGATKDICQSILPAGIAATKIQNPSGMSNPVQSVHSEAGIGIFGFLSSLVTFNAKRTRNSFRSVSVSLTNPRIESVNDGDIPVAGESNVPINDECRKYLDRLTNKANRKFWVIWKTVSVTGLHYEFTTAPPVVAPAPKPAPSSTADNKGAEKPKTATAPSAAPAGDKKFVDVSLSVNIPKIADLIKSASGTSDASPPCNGNGLSASLGLATVGNTSYGYCESNTDTHVLDSANLPAGFTRLSVQYSARLLSFAAIAPKTATAADTK